MLAKPNVGNDLSTNIVVEQPDELLAAHAQVGTKGRYGETDEERLVADAHIGGVASDGRTGNQRPRRYEAPLEQRGFNALHTQVAHDELADLVNVAVEHLF